MSIALLACARRGAAPLSNTDVQRIATRLRPANLPPDVPAAWSHTEGTVVAAVFFPCSLVCASGLSITLGPEGLPDTVSRDVGLPEGASGFLRADADRVVIATDPVASRTLWFIHTDTVFLASTSQRALLAALGTFEPDETHLAWVLATGKIAPRRGWDRRVSPLQGDSTLRLDRAAWTLRLDHRQRVWQGASDLSTKQHLDRLDHALDETFSRLPRGDDVILPISGGYDSRGLLVYLQRHIRPGNPLRAITWGRREALDDRWSDAAVARDLCQTLGVAQTFHALTPVDVDFGEVFRRFVANGEGRIDHLAGYLDGFALWASLREHGLHGIFRGDMAFGYPPAHSPRDLRFDTGVPHVADLKNLRTIPSLAQGDTVWPDDMRQRPGESPTAWNNRLGHTYRLPSALAALTQLKTGYVEVLNPLLSPRVLEQARQLPMELFVGKKAWKLLVRRGGPPVRFARRTATQPTGDVLARPDAVAFLRARLDGERAGDRLPGDVLAFVRAAVAPRAAPPPPTALSRIVGLLRDVRHLIPARLRVPLRAMAAATVNPRQVALRAAILCATHDLLREDSVMLRDRTPSA